MILKSWCPNDIGAQGSPGPLAPSKASLKPLMDIFDALTRPRPGRRLRSSTWDRSGANADFVRIDPGASHDMLDVQGAGVIRHIWITAHTRSINYPREVVIRAYWDGFDTPSVEAPLGDFFGCGHAKIVPFTSAPLTVVTGNRPQQFNLAAFNCWFAMPFAAGARITVTNEGAEQITNFYYYVDYDELPALPEDTLRFHAHYRQQRPTPAQHDLASLTWQEMAALPNLSDEHNYRILETRGRGNYVGTVLSTDHLDPVPQGGWFGEGDDMFFIDGRPGLGSEPRPESAPGANDAWPPTLHGTGTEDYFCHAWGYPAHHHAAPYHGVTVTGVRHGEALEYAGKWTTYRFHIADPVMFEESLRVSIEHGHANCHANDYSSVAYWYQWPLAQGLPPLPPVEKRLPLSEIESVRSYLRNRKPD